MGMRVMFKTVDQKIADLGFIKVHEDKYGVEYERQNDGYTQRVDIVHKASGNHILQSYDPALYAKENGNTMGNGVVGLTCTELLVFGKKMKQLGLNS